jgi:hypothetical protein
MLNRTRFIQMTMTAIATVVVVVCLALSVPDLSSITTPSGADSDSNPPWFPSLMAFEHYDSARTHLFKQAHFAGSFDGDNKVAVRTAPVIYPTGYNLVYLNRHEIFLYEIYSQCSRTGGNCEKSVLPNCNVLPSHQSS